MILIRSILVRGEAPLWKEKATKTMSPPRREKRL